MKVFVSTHVHAYTGGKSSFEGSGATLGELMLDIDKKFPGLRFRIIDEQDRIRQHMNIFVNTERARVLETPIKPTDEVHILGSLSGG